MTLDFLDGQSNRNGGIEFELLKMYREPRDHHSSSDLPHAYASEAYGCSRKTAMRIAGFKAANDISLMGAIARDIGNFLHDKVQALLTRIYEDRKFQAEVPWNDDLISGRADGLYQNADGEAVVLEIKSMGEWGFKQALKRNEPDPGHLMQAQISAVFFKAKWVHLLYIRKVGKGDEPATLEWVLPVDRQSAVAEINRLKAIAQGVRDGKIADRIYDHQVVVVPDRKKWPCNFCPYIGLCEAAGPGEKTIESYDRLATRKPRSS